MSGQMMKMKKDDHEESFDMNRLNKWMGGGNGKLFTSTQIQQDDTYSNVLEDTMLPLGQRTPPKLLSEEKLKEAKVRIIQLQNSADKKDTKIQSLEDSLKTKDELLNITKAEKESLEIHKIRKENEKDQFIKAFKMMEAEIAPLKNVAPKIEVVNKKNVGH